MVGTVRYANFVPINTSTHTAWEDVEVDLTSRIWGITANQNNKRFTYPLRVTHVRCGEEGWCRGVLVGDIIVEINSIKVTQDEDLLKLRTDENKFVSDTIQRILIIGGTCRLKIKREYVGPGCIECGRHDIIEVSDKGESCKQRSSVHMLSSKGQSDQDFSLTRGVNVQRLRGCSAIQAGVYRDDMGKRKHYIYRDRQRLGCRHL
jgi:hypothetical protein